MKMPDERHRLTRSLRLRKYESVYESCMKTSPRKGKTKRKPAVSEPEKTRKDKPSKEKEKAKSSKEKDKSSKEKDKPSKEKDKPSKEKDRPSKAQSSKAQSSKDKSSKAQSSKGKPSKDKPPTEYQQFVKDQSKKEDYKGMTPPNRMREIAKAWRSRP